MTFCLRVHVAYYPVQYEPQQHVKPSVRPRNDARCNLFMHARLTEALQQPSHLEKALFAVPFSEDKKEITTKIFLAAGRRHQASSSWGWWLQKPTTLALDGSKFGGDVLIARR